MDYIKHPSNNHAFGAPAGWNQQEVYVGTLPVTLDWESGQRVIRSFWKPDALELSKLLQGSPVVLTVFGQQQPIVAIGVEA